MLNEFLTEDGVVDGNINATGDYSSGATFRYIVPASGLLQRRRMRAQKLEVSISDTAINVHRYGNIAGLTTAFSLQVIRRGTPIDITAGQFINTWGDFMRHCGPTGTQRNNQGPGQDYLVCEFDFTRLKAGGIDLRTGDSVDVLLSANFTGLNSHQFKLIGEDLS